MHSIYKKSKLLSEIFTIPPKILTISKTTEEIDIVDNESLSINDVIFNDIVRFENKQYNFTNDELIKLVIFFNKYAFVDYYKLCVNMMIEKILLLEYDKKLVEIVPNDIIDDVCSMSPNYKNNVIA